MSGNLNYLEGSVYHMVHIDNLQSILERRAILSRDNVLEEEISYQSIAFEEVQGLRDRVFVWDFSTKSFRSLHSYVPFYFAMHTAMLYVQFKKGIQDKLVVLELSRSILHEQGVLFTDGNASNQQLSKYSREIVRIVPATTTRDTCRRKYLPGGPYGLNINRSDFYSDVAFLERLRWDIINDRWSENNDKKRIRHAEVLIPDILPLGKLQGIAVRTQNMVLIVNDLIARCGLEGRIPQATCKPAVFF